YLCRFDAEALQRARQLFLRADASVPDQLHDLSVAEALRHPACLVKSLASRARASSSAAATAFGPVPPVISRVFMPSRASRYRAISGVNSGAKAARVSPFQSPGFLPVRTLSSTSLPAI